MKNLKYSFVILIGLIFSMFPEKGVAQWNPVGNYADSVVFGSIILQTTTDAAGNIYAAGQFTNSDNQYYVAKWDGVSWTILGNNSNFNNTILSLICDAAGNLYVSGYFSNSIGYAYIAKWDGSSWSEVGGAGTSTFNGGIRCLTFDAGGNLLAGGYFTNVGGAYYVAKWDGSSWSEMTGSNTSFFNYYIFSLASDSSGNVYAAGMFYNSNSSFFVAKWDGSDWAEVGGANSSTFLSNNYNGIASIALDAGGNLYAGGDFVNANGNFYVAKWDGISWSEVGGDGSSPLLNGYFGIAAISFDAAGNLYTGGDFSDASYNNFVAKWDGSSWSDLGAGSPPLVTGSYGICCITIDINGVVYTAGDIRNASNNSAVVKWGGSSWVELHTPDIMLFSGWGSIYCMAVDLLGNIYAAGYLENNRGLQYVAKWDGNRWNKLGGDTSMFIDNSFFSLTTDLSGNLYAGGFFTNDIFSGNSFVAKWDGSGWSEVGGAGTSTLNSYINSVVTDASGNIYTAGSFTNDPTWPNGNRYVAKWDGSSWSELGGANTSSFNDDITSLCVDAGGNLYAAGLFTNSSGKKYVAKWDGSSWSELGGSNTSVFDSTIYSLSVDANGNVFASGQFTNSNGNKYVAKWDGSSWSELGGANTSTVDFNITDLVTTPNGNVYATGLYTNNNGNWYVSQWDGSNWSELGGTNLSTFNSSTRCLATDVYGNIYTAGDFTLPDRNYYTKYVAKYDSPTNVSQIQTPTSINIYPNPSRDIITIQTDGSVNRNKYSVWDPFGRVVLSGRLIGANTTISLSGLTNGIYMFRIDDTQTHSFKLVKE